MKKYGMIVSGLFMALFFALLGMATAMTPAPTSGDKSLVVLSLLLFVVGIGLMIAGVVRWVRHKG